MSNALKEGNGAVTSSENDLFDAMIRLVRKERNTARPPVPEAPARTQPWSPPPVEEVAEQLCAYLRTRKPYELHVQRVDTGVTVNELAREIGGELGTPSKVKHIEMTPPGLSEWHNDRARAYQAALERIQIRKGR